MNQRTRTTSVAAAIAAAAFASTALAQAPQTGRGGGGANPDVRSYALFRDLFDTFGEWHGPILNVAYQPQLQYQWSSNPTGNGKGINDFYGSVALGAYMWITPELSINANVSLDQVDSPSNPDQWAFYGEGIQAGDIWIEWTDQRTGIIAGRFTSLFGLAPRLLPGVFDTNIVNNYSFGGLLGVQGSLSTGDEGGGIHSLNVEGFGVDTTFLSGSAITPTPKPTGPGTGGGMDSFCINYTGANIPFIFPTLQVSASYIQFGTGNGAPVQEKGMDIGFSWQYVIDGSPDSTLDAKYFTVGPLFEYAHFWDEGGNAGAWSDYYTFGIIGNYGNWQSDVAITWQPEWDPTTGNDNGLLVSANLGYNFFGPQSLVQIGYAYNDSGGQIDHQVGLQVNLPINMLQYFPLGD